MPIAKKCLNVRTRIYKPRTVQHFKPTKSEATLITIGKEIKPIQEEPVKNEEQPKKKSPKKEKKEKAVEVENNSEEKPAEEKIKEEE